MMKRHESVIGAGGAVASGAAVPSIRPGAKAHADCFVVKTTVSSVADRGAKLCPQPEARQTQRQSLLDRLEAESAQRGKGELFRALKSSLSSNWGEGDYAEIAASFEMSAGTLQVTHRMRRCCRELLEEEISHTVANPDEVESEVMYLLNLFS